MKNTALFILLVTCFSSFVYSQETFLKKYPSSDFKRIFSIIETDDNHLIFCGKIFLNPEDTERIGTMSKITSSGELIDSRRYNFVAGNSHFAELINSPATQGYYYLLGTQDSIVGDQSINSVFIHTIDNEMNIVTRRKYGNWVESVNDSWDFEVLGDTTAYILSMLFNHNSPLGKYSVLKANLTNNEFDYFIPAIDKYIAPSSMMIDEANELIKVNYEVFDLTHYPWNPVANISYDLMNIEVVMPDNQFFSQTKFGKKNDSAYFLSGAFIDDDLQRDLGIAEYNLNDLLLRQIKFPGGADSVTYPGSGKKNMLVTADYIWVMGWYNILVPGFPCQPEATYIVLNKLNHNLELIEQLFYGGDGVYFPSDIIETSDHHIVVAGEFYDNLAVPYNCHFDPFVLKVNSEGLIVGTPHLDAPVTQEAMVFPNPGSAYLEVKLAVQHKTAKFGLYDINGRLMMEENILTDLQRLSTLTLSQGTYIYRITSEGRVIGSGKWVKE